jgi:hypothetical protein
MSSSFTSQQFAMWVGAGLVKSHQIAMPYLHDMTGYLRHEFASFGDLPEATPIGRIANSIPGSAVREWEQGGTPSFLLETPTSGGFANTFANRRHTAEAQRRFVWTVYETEIKRRRMAALLGV